MVRIKFFGIALFLTIVLFSVGCNSSVSSNMNVSAINNSIMILTPLTPLNDTCWGYNVSIAPLARFCYNRGMVMFNGGIFQDSGCIDGSGEYHYYDIKMVNNTWHIGNETYSPTWSCG